MNKRRLRLESLEERTLLTVTAGGTGQEAAVLPAPTEATTWVVNTAVDPASWNSSDNVISLREALGRASAKDRIVFSQSLAGRTIKLGTDQQQLQISNGITIDATSIGGITIDAAGRSRVFYIFGGTSSAPVELIGLTITGGNAPRDFGGGIYNDGVLKITNSAIIGNSARDFGGGIYNWLSGTVTITNSVISGNDAGIGGGIYNGENSSVTIVKSDVSWNTADTGGGVYNIGEMTVTGTAVSGNYAYENGGGFSNSGILTITDTAVFGNSAYGNGGGIYSDDYGMLMITNLTVAGNTAGVGGGIYNGGGELTMSNTVVALNDDEDDSSDIYNVSYPISGSSNIVGFDPGFVTAPVFESGALINFDELDLSLSSAGWAIDRGTNSVVETTADLAGNPRIYAAWKAAATVDIGAYEYQGRVVKEAETPSLTVTTELDVIDDTDRLISLREAVLYAKAGDVITFDAALAGKAVVLDGTEIFIDKAVTIDAAGVQGMTIDGDGKSRVFNAVAGTKSAPVKLISLTVTGGRSTSGGGILNSGSLTVTDTAMFGNSAEIGGGICNTGEMTVNNTTVSGNSAGGGSGIYSGDTGKLTLTNSIASFNYAGPDKLDDVRNVGSISSKSSIIGTDPGFKTAPVFDGTGRLINGASLDLTLSPTSPAIDTGDNRYVTAQTDLAGNPRIYAAWKTTPTVDIGAYEYPERCEKEVEDPSLIVTTALDVVDNTDYLISLREAILYAKWGDVVTFDPALAGETIVLNGTDLFIGEVITIDATGAKGITIDGDGKSRVISVGAGTASAPVKLIGLTVTGGNGTIGGGISNSAALEITDSVIFGNSADSGGGIYNSGTLTVTDTAVTANSANGSGGGIYNDPGSSLTVTGTAISENSAQGNGGGIYNSGTLKITKSDISVNSAGSDGGGIYGGSGRAAVTYSFISGNSAGGSGGGFYSGSDEGSSAMTNSAVFGNTANNGGGIYHAGDGELMISSATVAGNSARDGGGIYAKNCIGLQNSIVTLNYAAGGGKKDIRDYGGTIPDTSIVGLDPDFMAAPVFDGAGHLVNYDSVDLALSATSIAIDSGDNSYVNSETDLAGKARIVGLAVDIGAYEFLISDSTVVTTNLDTVDFTDNLVSLREAILCTAEGGTVTFDSGLAGKKIRLRGSQLEINAGITIDASGIGGITVDAGWGSRIFYVSGGTEENPVELIGLTMTNGYAEIGGGIYNRDGTLILTGCTLKEDSADTNGGGIYNRSGMVTMTDCRLELNTAYGDGGGIFNLDLLTMNGCSVVQNAAYGSGGIRNEGTMTMTACTVTENEAFGAAGGGIFNGETLTMTNCSVSMNSADTDGAGVYNIGTLTMANGTLSGNSAASRGGGIYNSGRRLTMLNSIIALNSSNIEGEDVYKKTASDYACNVLSSFTDWTESANCLPYNPSKPLFENAGGGDYSLAQGSQAINKGNNSYVAAQTDLAGNPRIVGGIVDLGAYEYQGSVIEQLEAPTITTGNRGIYVSHGANRHLLQWTAVDNASGYEVQYTADGSSWSSAAAAGTDAVVRGLSYGADVTYRVRALGDGVSYTDSEWSRAKTFNVCPMDINNDGDIGGLDRNILATSWGTEEGDDGYRYYADINADGDIGGLDRNFLGSNWGAEAGDDDLSYPRPVRAADAVFAAYEPGDPNADFGVF